MLWRLSRVMLTPRLCTVPTEFTSIPFPIKALKLVLTELQSDGEPASLSYGGVGLEDVQADNDAESDDGVRSLVLSCDVRGLALMCWA